MKDPNAQGAGGAPETSSAQLPAPPGTRQNGVLNLETQKPPEHTTLDKAATATPSELTPSTDSSQSATEIEPFTLSIPGASPLKATLPSRATDGESELPASLPGNNAKSTPRSGLPDAEHPGLQKLQEGLKAAGPAGVALRKEARTTGEARLQADRASFQHRTITPASKTSHRVEPDAPGLAQKTPLLPLPAVPEGAPVNLKLEQDIARLSEAIAKADSPEEIDELKLSLAAAQVGAGDWAAARQIYQELLQGAQRKDIRETAQRNLGILGGGAAAPAASAGSPRTVGAPK
ncbi:MAG: hypothetical protein HYZ00_11890 [Candidatus Hydrogenedentes bacterium]|nr:hypothetical protein [Candidatus Hydrogenedentota bacterium]